MDIGYFTASALRWLGDLFSANVAGVVSTVSATFLGAYFAFLFERLKRQREEEDTNVNTLNRGLFALYQMWNLLRHYQREHLDVFRDRHDRWLNLSSNPLAVQARTQFKIGDLSFLLDKEANVFANITVQEYRFKLAIGLIERRSELMLREVFPRMDLGQQRVLADVERIIGKGLTHQLRQYTDQIFAFVDADVRDLEAAFAELRAAAERIHPGRKFIGADFNPDLNVAG